MRYHQSLHRACTSKQAMMSFAARQRARIAAPNEPDGFALAGIEIEVENAPAMDDHLLHPWTGVSDGSLRNNGLELISTPIRTPQMLARYANKYTSLREDFNWRDTVRTSTHVHLDVRGRSLTELVQIIAAYMVVEPLLYKQAGPLREENIYCVPLYRADNVSPAFVAALKLGNIDSVFQGACKYSGLFIGPVVTFGTIEFRMAPSFPSGVELSAWVHALQMLYHGAMRISPAEGWQMLDEGRYRDFVDRVLPQEFTDCTDSELADMIEDNSCDTRASSIYEMFLPAQERKWVLPAMKEVESGPAELSLPRMRHVRGRNFSPDIVQPRYGIDAVRAMYSEMDWSRPVRIEVNEGSLEDDEDDEDEDEIIEDEEFNPDNNF